MPESAGEEEGDVIVAGLNMTIRVADIEEVKAVIGSAIELEKLIKCCENKSQIDNSAELHLLRSALDALAGPTESK
ncbi:MAG: hypothetical protein WC375_10975, partial [Methanomassiliicoccales archaeon]